MRSTARWPAAAALVAAGCASPRIEGVPSGPIPELAVAWSAWTKPVNGLSFRVSLPERARCGDRLPVGFALRFDRATVPEGTTHFDHHFVADCLTLLLRNRATGATLDLDDDDEEWVAPTIEGDPQPALDDLARTDDAWVPMAGDPPPATEYPFLLALAWDALSAGEWEVRARLDANRRDYPGLWRGSVTTGSLPLVLEKAPLRRVRVRIPTDFSLEAGDAQTGGLRLARGAGRMEVVDVEVRNGFRLGVTVEHPDGGSMTTGFAECADGEELEDGTECSSLSIETPGPWEATCSIVVFESPLRARDGLFPCSPTTASRTLWTKSFRLAATAEEIETLRKAAKDTAPAAPSNPQR